MNFTANKKGPWTSLVFLLLFMGVTALPIFAGEWVAASGGSVPNGASKQGNEADGTPLYLARAKYQGGLHPGKVRQAFAAANIPYGGKEVKVNSYEVFVGTAHWTTASNGKIPLGAVVVGYEANGEPLFSARAAYQGGVHLGKVRPSFGAANIPYGGKEIKVNPYEVLVSD